MLNQKLSVVDRLVGNPISWGVCEVPDWGFQIDARTVLGEMRSLGLKATEQGPVGYLGSTVAQVSSTADEFGLPIVGAFVALVMHDRSQRVAMRSAVHAAASLLSETGKGFFITAVVASEAWGQRFELSSAQWQAIFDGLSGAELAIVSNLDGAPFVA